MAYDRALRYGEHPDQIVDLWRPVGGGPQRPPVVFVHGGFWRVAYDRTGCTPLAEDLTARGYPVALVEYRRVGQDGGGWPGTLDDVAAAIDTAARALGTPVVGGHSAGGHLALWYAGRWPQRVRGIVALAPVADLALAYGLGLGGGAVAALLGGGPAERPDAYASAEPAGGPAPVRIVHGLDDDVVPVAVSRAYVARAGGRLAELSGVDHFAVIDPRSTAWSTVVDTIDAIASAPMTTRIDGPPERR